MEIIDFSLAELSHFRTRPGVDEAKLLQLIDDYFRYNHSKLHLALAEAVEILRANGIIAMPTDTIYGLLIAHSAENAEKLAQIRGRDLAKPFLATIPFAQNLAHLVDLNFYASTSKDFLENFMAAKWPGRNTLILKKAAECLYPFGSSIALRRPDGFDNILFYYLLNTLKQPILAPSLNRPGEMPYWQKEQILANFPQGVDLLFYAVDYDAATAKASQIWDLQQLPPQKIR